MENPIDEKKTVDEKKQAEAKSEVYADNAMMKHHFYKYASYEFKEEISRHYSLYLNEWDGN
jgi:hypothetical protein